MANISSVYGIDVYAHTTPILIPKPPTVLLLMLAGYVRVERRK